MEIDRILVIEYAPGRPETEDAVQGVLFLTSCLGSTIEERGGRTVVEAYFSSEYDRSIAERILDSDDVTLRREDRTRVDWLALYQQSLKPVEVGRRLVIVPDDSIESAPGRIRIIIPQERAFGTGSHESTALVMELMEDLELNDARGLDVGTGSGILAIAMAKLGARSVFAFDNDFQTFGIVEKNFRRNKLPGQSARHFFGEVASVRGPAFDVIAMNIIPEVIMPLFAEMIALMGAKSALLISGITADRRSEVLAAARSSGLGAKREHVRGEWWAADLRRSGKR